MATTRARELNEFGSNRLPGLLGLEILDTEGETLWTLKQEGEASACVVGKLSTTGIPSLDDLRGDTDGGGAELMQALDRAGNLGVDALLGIGN